MTVPVTKRLAVTFRDGLPIGERGEFTYDKQRWVAYPARRYTAILTVLDRLLGAHAGVQRELLRLLSDHPEDAARVARILGIVTRARCLHRDLAGQKVRI